VVVGGLAMITVGVVLGYYEMSVVGAPFLAVIARISLAALRARRARNDASQ
jgi:hypothetical protein